MSDSPGIAAVDGMRTDFDVYRPGEQATHFLEGFARLQASTTSPLLWSTANGGHWIPTRGQDVFYLYGDHARFSSRFLFVPREDSQIPIGAISLDPPEHGPFRAYLNEGLTPTVVKGKEASVRALAVDLIERLKPLGGCEFISDFADVLPLTVFLQLVDLPLEDRAMLGGLVEEGTRHPDPAGRVAALGKIAAYLTPHIESRRRAPGDDLLSKAVNSDINGRLISVEEATGAAIHLMGAGLDTVSSLLSFVMLFLARHPGHRQALIENPELVSNAAMELIRRFAPVTMARQARMDVDFHGTVIRKGDMVALPGALYNLDPDIYEAPLRVDWQRRVRKVLTFGNGPHRCPGALLGRAELVIVLQEWLTRIPDFHVPQDADVPVAGGIVAKITQLPIRW